MGAAKTIRMPSGVAVRRGAPVDGGVERQAVGAPRLEAPSKEGAARPKAAGPAVGLGAVAAAAPVRAATSIGPGEFIRVIIARVVIAPFQVEDHVGVHAAASKAVPATVSVPATALASPPEFTDEVAGRGGGPLGAAVTA